MKRFLGLLLTSVWLTGCGGPPNGPSGTAPQITGINPTSGPTSGGTVVTIQGANFSAGATVTIGGLAAGNVNFLSATTLTGTTARHAAGLADVVVTVGGRSGSLPGAFTYVAGAPPLVTSVVARGTRPNEPERFADLDEEINVTAIVQDADTAAADLRYTWSAPAGTFIGTGAIVKWRAPVAAAFTTPGLVTLTVNVSDGDSTATGNAIVRVHNSAKEVGDMARQFLVDFSEQTLLPEQIVRNFSDVCRGKQDELTDVRNNQLNFDITQWTVGTPNVSVNFAGFCPFRSRFGDACAIVPVDWFSTCISERRMDGTKVCELGQKYRATGFDHVSAVYNSDRWWLCDSDFEDTQTFAVTGTLPRGFRFKK